MEEIKTKVCKRCGKEAPITEFSKNKQSKDGHHIYCRTCRNELALKYYYNKKARLANNTSGGVLQVTASEPTTEKVVTPSLTV